MPTLAKILERYECGPLRFAGDENASYERHLVLDHLIDPSWAHPRQKFEALACAVRDLLAQRWIKTRLTHGKKNPKRVYYLSMEFLIGRSLNNNITNLMIEPLIRDLAERDKFDLVKILEQEPDAGLGNGGLGRLAACFIDSLATLQIPAVGYGLRYEYGIFRQEIKNGWQVETPDNWLRRPDPWEIARPEETAQVNFGAALEMKSGQVTPIPGRTHLFGIPYDRPVVGYGGKTINTLRLWGASTADYFDFGEFNTGDFFGAVSDKVLADTLTRVLYPDDSTASGRSLRFVQEYFLVACSVEDILNRFRRHNEDWRTLPDKVAIQLNDTHPSLAVAELMVYLLDRVGLDWDTAWDLTTRTLAYTNHTLLPEALEKWPIDLFERLLPRHLEVVYQINSRFLDAVRKKYPGDGGRLTRMSLIEEDGEKKVRMANLAIVGSHSTNGVAEIHSRLLGAPHLVKDFAEMFPERFNNKTNGVTPRRWLLMCNPDLSGLIKEAIGDGWIADLEQLTKLKPLAEDAGFRDKFLLAKRKAKEKFAHWLRSTTGEVVDPHTMFDCQVKRIHEYKRQLLNVLHVIVLYNRLRNNPRLDVPPRTFLFAGKAAPAYVLAKRIIKLINNVAAVIDADPVVSGKLKVLFLTNYSVSLSERLIPASDVSEQISTAGYEASGTSNMKFMMNGALTVGTRDGATIEMARAAGEENFFLFGLTAEQVANNRGWYSPLWHYQNEPETKAALDLIISNYFSKDEPGIFEPIRETLLAKGDFYMHLADLTAYTRTHEKVGELYRDPHAWAKKAILNVGSSGWFSSDRTIRQYAEEIWGAKPCPVE